MKTKDLKSEDEGSPVFHSFEEMEQYYQKLEMAEAKKWGVLYPLKISVERLIYWAGKYKKEIFWVFQRIIRKHHCADVDLWSLDLHISHIILPKLEAFRKQKLHVTPTGDLKTWHDILDEIIYAFRWNIYANWQRNPKKEREFYIYYFNEDDPNINYFRYFDSGLVIKAANRAQKGFELFGKYFTCLWD